MNWHKCGEFVPLVLVMHGQQKYKVVNSLRQLAEVLVAHWPYDESETYRLAARACLDAIHGKLPPLEARTSLIRAAAEAGIPVISVVPEGDSTELAVFASNVDKGRGPTLPTPGRVASGFVAAVPRLGAD